MKLVVIGATQGLGLELVKQLAQTEHNVIAAVYGNTVPPLLQELIDQNGGKIHCVSCDVTKDEQVEACAAFAKETFTTVDALINCAGILKDSDRKNLLQDVVMADLRQSFDVNVIGAIAVIKHFYPIMKKDGTAPFVTITSEGCDIGNCGTWIPAYALSKCAETKIAGIMNQSVQDVRFFSMHPGRMRTEMGRDTWNMEPADSARGILQLVTTGEIFNKGTWYMDYKGMDMMNSTY